MDKICIYIVRKQLQACASKEKLALKSNLYFCAKFAEMIAVPNLKYTESGNFFLIAGPCAVESREVCFEVAERMIEICDKWQIPYIFKASYKKANRSRLDSFTGIGDDLALGVLKEIRDKFEIPVLTDVHTTAEIEKASLSVDVLQIPAFLCRQTELLVAAAKSGKHVNIKKGQFMSPEAMNFAVEKVKQSGNPNVWLTERGTTFGYQDLVVDFRNIPIMQRFDVPVVLDCTHSLQKPNQSSGVTGGSPELIETIAKAGIAVGCDGIFMETHPNPKNAKSDGANMIQLDKIEEILLKLVKIRQNVNFKE